MGKRILSWAKWPLIVALAIVCLTWLYLYFNSVHQRRKAERLLADLATLPMGADFAQVRDFSIRYGGSASPANVEPGVSTCPAQGCIFEIEITPATTALPRESRFWNAIVLAETSVGLRPWVVSVNLTLKNGSLQRSNALVGQERMERVGHYSGPTSIFYSIGMNRTATANAGSDYVVVQRHPLTGEPTDLLEAEVVQTPSGKWKRAFDVHLDCFTAIWRGYADFGQLAPSAWADYQDAANSSQ